MLCVRRKGELSQVCPLRGLPEPCPNLHRLSLPPFLALQLGNELRRENSSHLFAGNMFRMENILVLAKKRHVSKQALSVVPCPFFAKKKFCCFHEAGQCWYEHSSFGSHGHSSFGSTSAAEVLDVQETPYLPHFCVPMCVHQTYTEPVLPFETNTEHLLGDGGVC